MTGIEKISGGGGELFRMGAYPQSCTYPLADGPYPSRPDDEAIVNGVRGQFQPAPSEVGPPFSEPISVDRVRRGCVFVGTGAIYSPQCNPGRLGEGPGEIGSISVEWTFGVDGKGAPAVASNE